MATTETLIWKIDSSGAEAGSKRFRNSIRLAGDAVSRFASKTKSAFDKFKSLSSGSFRAAAKEISRLSNLRVSKTLSNDLARLSSAFKTFKGPTPAKMRVIEEFFRVLNGARINSTMVSSLSALSVAFKNLKPPTKSQTANLVAFVKALSGLKVPANARAIASALGAISTASGRASKSLSGLRSNVSNLGLNKVATGARNASTALGGLNNSLQGTTRLLRLAGAAAGGLTLGTISKGIFDATIKVQRFSVALKSVLDSPSEVADITAFVTRESDKLGVSLEGTIDRFAKLVAAMKPAGVKLNDIKDIFTGLATAGSVFGSSAEEMKLIFLAVEQVFSKGKVSTEELRRQLGERLPGAFQLFAKSAVKQGIIETTQDLDKALRDGKISASAFIPFVKDLGIQFKRSLIDAAKRADFQLNVLNNSFFKFKKNIGEAGFGDALTKLFKNLAERMNKTDIEVLAKRLGESFGNFISATEPVFMALINNIENVITVTKIFLGLLSISIAKTVFGFALAPIVALGTGIGKLGTFAVNAIKNLGGIPKVLGLINGGSTRLLSALRLLAVISLAPLLSAFGFIFKATVNAARGLGILTAATVATSAATAASAAKMKTAASATTKTATASSNLISKLKLLAASAVSLGGGLTLAGAGAGVLTAAIVGLGITAAVGAFGVLTGAVTKLTDEFSLLQKEGFTTGEILKAAWQTITQAASDAAQDTGTFFSSLPEEAKVASQGIVKWFDDAWVSLKAGLGPIPGFFSATFNEILAVITPIINRIIQTIGGIGSAIAKAASSVFAGLKKIDSNLERFFNNIGAGNFKKAFSFNIFEGVGDASEEELARLGKNVRASFGGLNKVFTDATDSLNSVFSVNVDFSPVTNMVDKMTNAMIKGTNANLAANRAQEASAKLRKQRLLDAERENEIERNREDNRNKSRAPDIISRPTGILEDRIKNMQAASIATRDFTRALVLLRRQEDAGLVTTERATELRKKINTALENGNNLSKRRVGIRATESINQNLTNEQIISENRLREKNIELIKKQTEFKSSGGSAKGARAARESTKAVSDFTRSLQVLQRQEELGRISVSDSIRLRNQLTNAIRNGNDPLARQNGKVAEERILITLSNGERKVEIALRKVRNKLIKEGVDLTTASSIAMLKNIEDQIRLNEQLKDPSGFNKFKDNMGSFAEDIKKLGERIQEDIGGAIADFIVDGKFDFKSMINSWTKDLIKMSVSSIFRQFFGGANGTTGTSGLGGIFSSLFSGSSSGGLFGSSTGGGFFSFLGGLFRDGGISQSPTKTMSVQADSFRNVRHFINGGDTMNAGGGGIPAILHQNEAVIPLKNGAVPVSLTGGVGGGGTTINNITMNITTPDAESFQRSQGQIQARIQSGLLRASTRNN